MLKCDTRSLVSVCSSPALLLGMETIFSSLVLFPPYPWRCVQIKIPNTLGFLSDHLLWGTQVWKLRGVKRGHGRHGTTDVMLGLCSCSFRSCLGCFSHTPVCVLGDLSGWCEILTEEARVPANGLLCCSVLNRPSPQWARLLYTWNYMMWNDLIDTWSYEKFNMVQGLLNRTVCVQSPNGSLYTSMLTR